MNWIKIQPVREKIRMNKVNRKMLLSTYYLKAKLSALKISKAYMHSAQLLIA